MGSKKLTRKQKVQIQEEEAKRVKAKELFKSRSNLSKFFILFGIIFLLIFGNLWLNRNKTISDSDLISIDANIRNEIKKEWKKSIGEFVKIELNEYPETKFRIGRHGANGVKVSEINNKIRNGNSFKLQILKEDFEQIQDKKTVWVYGILDKNRTYYSVDYYNTSRNKDRNSIYTYLLIGFSICLIVYGILLKLKNKEPADNKR